MKQSKRQRARQRQRLNFVFKLIPVLATAVTTGFIFFLTVFESGIPKTTIAGNGSVRYPNLNFHDPVLINGVEGQINAVYKFTNVDSGLDATIQIMDIYNGARLDDIDHFTAGYYRAWQPFIGCPPMATSWIDWRITFKVAGTNNDSVLSRLSATAVDVDGDGVALKELVAADFVKSYSNSPGSPLSIVFNNDSCQAVSTFANVANIDTNRLDAMFSMIFIDVSHIDYRTGAVSNYGAEEVRQNCIYFNFFDLMPEPLPVQLVSFEGKELDRKILLKWKTVSEVNNNYFTVERSKDGKIFAEIAQIKGYGSTSSSHEYYYIDQSPVSGTSYYRLKQTDFNGKTEVCRYISILLKEQPATISAARISPNPFNDSFTVQFESLKKEEAFVQLIGISGKIMFTEKIMLEEGANLYRYIPAENLNPGAYIFRIRNNENILSDTKVICRKS